MQLPSTRGQQYRDFTYDASGTIASATAPQLVLPERKSTSFLLFQNTSANSMYIEFGSARGVATLSGSTVGSIAVTNGGFGFTLPPKVHLLGGAQIGWVMADGNYIGAGLPQYPAPSNTAVAHAVLTAGAVSSIVVDNPGANYSKAPYVFISDNMDDPYGCAAPSATSGILLASGSAPLIFNGTCCSTDPLAVFCGTLNSTFTCKWMS